MALRLGSFRFPKQTSDRSRDPDLLPNSGPTRALGLGLWPGLVSCLGTTSQLPSVSLPPIQGSPGAVTHFLPSILVDETYYPECSGATALGTDDPQELRWPWQAATSLSELVPVYPAGFWENAPRKWWTEASLAWGAIFIFFSQRVLFKMLMKPKKGQSMVRDKVGSNKPKLYSG